MSAGGSAIGGSDGVVGLGLGGWGCSGGWTIGAGSFGGAVESRREGGGSLTLGTCSCSEGTGIVGTRVRSVVAEFNRGGSGVGGIGVNVFCKPVGCEGSVGGGFDGWWVSVRMLLEAAATASSLLKGAMPSFGFGIVDGSGLGPPLPFTVCPVVAPPTGLEVASAALLFSIVPVESQMSYELGSGLQILTQSP